MGYRSDVRIVTTRKGFEELMLFSNEFLKGTGTDNLLDSLDFKAENDYQICFGWNIIKWSEYNKSCKDVCAVMDGLKHLEENELSYVYARIGEDYQDVEERSFGGKDEAYLTYPYLIRTFDDEYMMDDLRYETMMHAEKDEELER
ncbi:MAG: hypothetical protein HUJ53_05800 [Holdemanella sp.]|nr:hypothetical protein [Holdemanella sp.]